MQKSAAKLVLFFLFLSPTINAQNIWRQKSFCPVKRVGASGFSIGTFGYTCSGSDGIFYHNDLWQFDPAHNSWSQKATLPGTERISSTGFAINGFGYVGLGWTPSNSQLSDFFKYDPVSNSWTPVANFPTGIYTSSVFVLHNFAYVGLGFNPLTKSVYKYDPVADTWSQIADFPGNARQSAVAFSIDSVGYMGSGISGSSFSDFYAYHPGTNSWNLIAPMPNPARYGAAVFSIGSKGFVGTGGAGSAYYVDFYSYDPLVDAWTAVANFPAAGRRHPACFTIGTKGYVYGGVTTDSTSTFGFYEYGPTDVIGIDELSSDEHYSIFQNSIGEIVIYNSERKIDHEVFTVFALDGKKLLNKIIESDKECIQIPAHHNGLYLYQIYSEKGNKILKSGKIFLE